MNSYPRIEQALQDIADLLEDASNDLNQKLFSLLRNEYDYKTSREAIEEAINSNGYTFTEDGKLEN